MAKALLPSLVTVLLVVAMRGVAADGDPGALKWIQVHAWLTWASFGFLFPLGVILIRYNRSQSDPTAVVSPARARICYYVHIMVQSAAVGLATAGVFILVKTVGSEFDITHKRLGWALLILVMIMPLMGILRPTKGKPLRQYWFFVHWLFGTGAVVLGFVNIYIGIWMYQTHVKSIRSLDIAFSIQVAFMGLVYFLQGQWSYILRQGSVPDKTENQQDGSMRPRKSPGKSETA